MSHTNTDETKKIPLGSGDVYVIEFTGTIPTDTVIETETNMLGRVQGGASVEYKPSFYTAESDDGKASKKTMTKEELTLKLGIITWNAIVLNKLISTGTITEENGKRTLQLGGIANQDIKKYLFRFVVKDKVDGDIRVTVVGSNEAGFSLGFTKDKETAINPEIKAEPLDNNGRLMIYEEEILGLQTLDITLAKGTATGSTKVSAISPAKESTNSLLYHIGAKAETVSYGDTLTAGSTWATLVVNADITSVSAGEIISVVEINADGDAVKFGTATIVDVIA